LLKEINKTGAFVISGRLPDFFVGISLIRNDWINIRLYGLLCFGLFWGKKAA
jgi:hypothetical protein